MDSETSAQRVPITGFLASKIGEETLGVAIWSDDRFKREVPVLVLSQEMGAFGVPYRCQIFDVSVAISASWVTALEREDWWKRLDGLVRQEVFAHELSQATPEQEEMTMNMIGTLDSLVKTEDSLGMGWIGFAERKTVTDAWRATFTTKGREI